ncbi:hypothetical protein OHC33_006559 [Knufia fluminis]|uniref:Uncharacterized protein n=1 Tax=Knufia fluminis TaxID=191047 RepID=A0AAN8EMG2_9EURO|nr:hypothetical protein OHC33_006559 [Knufia fluminis]
MSRRRVLPTTIDPRVLSLAPSNVSSRPAGDETVQYGFAIGGSSDVGEFVIEADPRLNELGQYSTVQFHEGIDPEDGLLNLPAGEDVPGGPNTELPSIPPSPLPYVPPPREPSTPTSRLVHRVRRDQAHRPGRNVLDTSRVSSHEHDRASEPQGLESEYTGPRWTLHTEGTNQWTTSRARREQNITDNFGTFQSRPSTVIHSYRDVPRNTPVELRRRNHILLEMLADERSRNSAADSELVRLRRELRDREFELEVTERWLAQAQQERDAARRKERGRSGRA